MMYDVCMVVYGLIDVYSPGLCTKKGNIGLEQ